MTHAPGNGIEDLYRHVIDDVISQCKEAFLDESVDAEILQQIKKIWEEKVNESGAVDLNPKSQPGPAQRPTPKIQPQIKTGSNVITMAVGQQQETGPSTSEQQNTAHYTSSDILSNVGVNIVPQYGPGLQQIILQNGQVPQNMMMLSLDATGNYVPVTQEQLKNAGLFPQLDGNADFDGLLDGKCSDYKVDLNLEKGELIFKKKKSHKKTEKLKNKLSKLDLHDEKNEKEKNKLLMLIPQVDGGPEMSDSSSDDDEDEDEHISRIVERIEDKTEVEDDDAGDEEPLNSADDQSDDEDLDKLFESNNLIVCQFEKVNRARTKWKFTLKDGIMHLDGKDYCFQKCTGEAEW